MIYYIYIDGDTAKKISIEYPEIEPGIPDQNTKNLIMHDSVKLPYKAAKNLNRYGNLTKDYCYLKIKTNGNSNIRAILYDITVHTKNDCPIMYSLMNMHVTQDTIKCGFYSPDSIFAQLRIANYPCLVDIKQGQTEGYATIIDYWNSKKQ